jgi:hypothetical protein
MRMLPALSTAAAVAAAALLTACGSTQAPASTPASAVTSGTPASSPAAPQAARSTLPGSGGLAVCQSATLKIALDTSQAGGATGSTYYPVNFTNTAATPCGMYGYPGMSLVTAAGGAGTQIGAAAQEDPSFGRLTVRVPAGGVAHAWLQVAQAANYPASACDPATAHVLRVYPPGDTVASYVHVSLSTCASASTPVLTVTPVRSGPGERGVTP